MHRKSKDAVKQAPYKEIWTGTDNGNVGACEASDGVLGASSRSFSN